MIKKLVAILLTVSAVQSAFALVVDNKAGELESNVGQSTDAGTLVVTGTLNAADFSFIADKMSALTEIDMSGARVVQYSGEPLIYTNRTDSEADMIPDYAFLGMTGLRSVKFPADVVAIGHGAFAGTGLQTIELPETVTFIDDSAFKDCIGLTSVVIPLKVTEIGPRAFEGCKKLESLGIRGASLVKIGASAFSGCTSLTSLQVPSSVVTIGEKAFQGTGITSVFLGKCDNLLQIGAWAFADCNSLSVIYLPPSLRMLSSGMLFNDSQLGAFSIPGSVTVISDYALKGLSGMEQLFLPENLESIGSYAMQGWTDVDTIAAQNLKSVPELGVCVWDGVDQPSVVLTVPEQLEAAFRSAEQWQDFDITVKKAINGIESIVDNNQLSGVLTAVTDGSTLRISSVGGDDIVSVTVYDVAGRQWHDSAGMSPTKETEVNVSGWPRGVYVVATNVGVTKIVL